MVIVRTKKSHIRKIIDEHGIWSRTKLLLQIFTKEFNRLKNDLKIASHNSIPLSGDVTEVDNCTPGRQLMRKIDKQQPMAHQGGN